MGMYLLALDCITRQELDSALDRRERQLWEADGDKREPIPRSQSEEAKVENVRDIYQPPMDVIKEEEEGSRSPGLLIR